MADNIRTSPALRLRPGEHQTILFIGDLLMAVASVFAAIEVWRRYNFLAEVAGLIEKGFSQGASEKLVSEFVTINVPAWFYFLPIIWLVFLIELYDPHVAGSGRKTTRGIAVAALFGLIAFSLLFMTRQDTNLPRVGVGAFLVFVRTCRVLVLVRSLFLHPS